MRNVGSMDQMVRIILGLVLLAIGLSPMAGMSLVAGLGAWRWVVTAVGAVMLATGFFRFCPLYTLLGVNTCAKD